jgi:hypothetical protein
MTAAQEKVIVTRSGDIATVALNNPERMNALSRPIWERLGAVMAELSADDSLRCVVIRGAGTKAFAAGADIAEFERERNSVEQAREYGHAIEHTIRSLAECRHPVVAMIHGHTHHAPESVIWKCPSPYGAITIPKFNVGTAFYKNKANGGDKVHFTIFRLGRTRLEAVGVSASHKDPTGPWEYKHKTRRRILIAPR